MSQDPAPYGARAFVVAVIQARLGSQGLPKKVLRMLCGGMPMLHVIHERLGLCHEVSRIVAAIPDTAENDPLAAVLHRDGIGQVRGPEQDLVTRYRMVFEQTSAAAIVRITADCPFVDPWLVDELVTRWRAEPGLDYVSNIEPGPRTFPDGLDVEVLSRAGFEKIEELSRHGDREPITTWVWQHQDRFRIATQQTCLELGDLRWTVDTPEDLAGARRVFAEMPEGFSWQDVLTVYGRTSLPEIGKGRT